MGLTLSGKYRKGRKYIYVREEDWKEFVELNGFKDVVELVNIRTGKLRGRLEKNGKMVFLYDTVDKRSGERVFRLWESRTSRHIGTITLRLDEFGS